MSTPHLGRFDSRKALLDYLELDFLQVKDGSRTLIYAESKKAKLVHKIFNVLRDNADRSPIKIDLREARLQTIGDAAKITDKELRDAVKTLADSFERWGLKHFAAQIGDEENKVSFDGSVSVVKGTPRVSWTIEFAACPQPDQEDDAPRSQEHLIQYLDWLQHRLEREQSGIGKGIYLPVDPVSEINAAEERGANTDGASTVEQRRWSQVRNSTSIAVVASAGRGKTSLLVWEARRLATLAERALTARDAATSVRIPIFLHLNELAASEDIDRGARLSLALREAGVIPEVVAAVTACVDHRNVVLLLDGLDEVDWSHRDVVDALLVDLAEARVTTIFTSRPEAFEVAAREVRRAYQSVTLPQFTSSQVSEYLQMRFSGGDSSRRSPVVLKRRRWEPLLLALVCDSMHATSVERDGGRENDLYDDLLRAMLHGGWRKEPHAERRRRGRTAPAKIRALEALAHHISASVTSTAPISDEIATKILAMHPFELGERFATSLDELVEGDGVLRRRGVLRPEIDFGHARFQSYLTAKSLSVQGSAGVDVALRRAWFDPHWEDVVVFMAGIGALQVSDVANLSEGPDAFNTRLYLAARCAGQMKLGSAEFSDVALRLLALVEKGQPNAVRALIAMGDRGYECVLRRFVDRPSAVLGEILAEVATDERAKRVLRVFVQSSADFSERTSVAGAAAQLGDPDSLRDLLSTSMLESVRGSSTHDRAWSIAPALATAARTDAAVEVLADEYRHKPRGSFSRRVLARALGGIHSSKADMFAWQILSDEQEPSELKGEVAYDLLAHRLEKSSALLFRASSEFSLLGSALFEDLSSLAAGGTRTMDEALRLMAASPDPWIASVAAMFTKADYDESKAKADHRALLRSEDVELQFDALHDLKSDELDLCVQTLTILSRHKREETRARVARCCNDFPPAAVELIVCELLNDASDQVRRQAIKTAGNLRLAAALPTLAIIEQALDAASRSSDVASADWQTTLRQLVMQAEGSDASLAFDAITAVGDTRYAPVATRRFHEGRASILQVARFRDDRLWPLIVDSWTSSIARATFDVSGRWHDDEIRNATIAAKDAAAAFGVFRDPRAIDFLLDALPGISAQVREPLFDSLNLMMTSRNAVEISTGLLDAVERIASKDTRQVVLTSTDGRVMDGERVMDYRVGFNNESLGVQDLLRRSAPLVRRAVEDRDWFAWCGRCESVLQDLWVQRTTPGL